MRVLGTSHSPAGRAYVAACGYYVRLPYQRNEATHNLLVRMLPDSVYHTCKISLEACPVGRAWSRRLVVQFFGRHLFSLMNLTRWNVLMLYGLHMIPIITWRVTKVVTLSAAISGLAVVTSLHVGGRAYRACINRSALCHPNQDYP